jgi:dTDP-4-amino-4,6-dideoxygalactose transaminase
MCASATAILHWGAIPVFADIDRETFTLDPTSIVSNITPLTRAIMVTDIFGQAADLDEIMMIARKHNLVVIEDAAQAPGAMYKGRYAGTIADIGVYSLNYHKHIHTGEGGVCVTNNQNLAERLQLIRNHAEAVVEERGTLELVNMVGYNFRMTEVEAAIGIEQLKKLKRLAQRRTDAAHRLSSGLQGLPGLRTPVVREGNTHVYYMYPLVLDPEILGVNRSRIVEALTAEGVPNLGSGYQLLHLLPIYQKKIAFGSKGFPWIPEIYKGHVSYDRGICPVAEKLHEHTYLGTEFCVNVYHDQEVDLVIEAFRKVWDNLDRLADRRS